MTTLNVFSNGDHVGRYRKSTTGSIEFQYVDSWLQRGDAFPISLSLPLRSDPYVGDRVEAVFENLLPDNPEHRETIAEQVGSDGAGTFALLEKIGRDCVGSMQFLPEGQQPSEPTTISSDPLSDSEVAKLIRDLRYYPLGMREDEPFRISLAGQQEKTALLHLDGDWHEPLGPTPTTHLLKPEIDDPRLFKTVENEYFCMTLADQLGLVVPAVRLRTFEGQRVLIVQRFDRLFSDDGTEMLRIHQEDFCQALGWPGNRKYDGSSRLCFDVLRESNQVQEDHRRLIRTLVFFWLIGANDGHLKNFSLFLSQPNPYRLTPLYDVMSVEPYSLDNPESNPPERSRESGNYGVQFDMTLRLAMGLGPEEKRDISKIRAEDFLRLAEESVLSSSELEAIIDDLSQTFPDALQRTLKQTHSVVPDSITQPIHHGATNRLSRLQTPQ